MEGKENLTAQIETQIEQSPTPVQTAQKATGQESNPVVTEARQLVDKNPKNNEFSNKALKGKSIEELLAMRDRLGEEPSVSKPVQEYETFDSPTAHDRYNSYYIDPSRTSREQWESLDDNDRPFVQALRAARNMYGTANEMAEDPEELQRHREEIANAAAELYRDYYSKDRYQKGVDQFIEKNRRAEESTNKHADWSRKSKAIARALKAAGYVEEQPKPDIPEEDDWQLQGARDSIAELIPGISAEDIDRVIQEMTTGRADDGSFIMKPEYGDDVSEDEIKDKLVKFLGQQPEAATPEELKQEVEKAIEEHPVESEQVIPDESPLNTEAEQAIDGGKDAEVRNDVVEDAIDNGEAELEKQAVEKPSIRRASINDFRKGIIDKETYRKQLYDQLLDAKEASNVNAYTRARKELAVLDILSDEQLKDRKLVAALKSVKNSKRMTDDELRNAMLEILQSTDTTPDTVITKSVIPDATPEEMENAPVDDITEEIDWISEQPTTKDGQIDWDKLTADWYTERERLNKPDQTVKDEFGKEIPDYEPIGDDPNYGKGAPGVMMHKDEDFAGSDELPAVINDGLPAEQYYDTSMYDFDWDWKDITPEHIISEVDNDDTIPKEEKDEVKRRRLNILGWSKGVYFGRVQNAKIEASKKELPKAGIKYGKAHNNMSILGNIGNATLSAKPISVEKRTNQQQSLPRTTASYSLGNKEDTTPKAVSMKNSAHQYGNEGAFARKGGMLGGRKKVGNIPMGKGMPMSNSTSPRSSGALRAPNAAEDMNILTLRDLIIKKSIKWPDRRLDKDGYLIVVRDNERVFVNKQLLENFTRDNPRKIKELRKIVQEN